MTVPIAMRAIIVTAGGQGLSILIVNTIQVSSYATHTWPCPICKTLINSSATFRDCVATPQTFLSHTSAEYHRVHDWAERPYKVARATRNTYRLAASPYLSSSPVAVEFLAMSRRGRPSFGMETSMAACQERSCGDGGLMGHQNNHPASRG